MPKTYKIDNNNLKKKLFSQYLCNKNFNKSIYNIIIIKMSYSITVINF